MKLLASLFALLFSINIFAADRYRIEVHNLTKGQPLTPPVIAVHSAALRIFEVGESASAGLALLAKDGTQDALVAELLGSKRYEVVKATQAILPGQKKAYIIEADRRLVVTIISMLARTNDAVVSVTFSVGNGEHFARVYDMGVENNHEFCRDIPAPPCNHPNVNPDKGEGFIHYHPGLHFSGDLLPVRDAFNTERAARIIIRKMAKEK